MDGRTRDLQRISTPRSKKSWRVGQGDGGRWIQTNFIVERSRNEEFDRSEAKTRARGDGGRARARTNTRAAYFKSHTIVRQHAKIQVNRRWDRDQAGRGTYQLAEENEETSFAITSSCNGCSEARPAPTVVLAVVSSGEGLGRPGVGCIHNQRDPSSVVQCRGQVEVGRGKVGEYTCSAAFGESDGGGCEIVAAIPWSSRATCISPMPGKA